MRAVRYAQEKRIEVIAKQGVLDADVDLDELDQHDADQHLQWKNSTFLDDGRNGEDILKGEKVDRRGIDYNWSVSSFAGERDTTVDGDAYTTAPRRLHASNYWKSPMHNLRYGRKVEFSHDKESFPLLRSTMRLGSNILLTRLRIN